MIATMQNENNVKSSISVKDMAALCGLSRQRFAQLVKAGIFPTALYDVATHRPFYPAELQAICVSVRQRNFGINQKAILFYARRAGPSPISAKVARTPKEDRNSEILDGLKSLGMPTVTAAQVAEAMKVLYPNGTANIEQPEVIRAVFIHLRRKNAGVNVGSK